MVFTKESFISTFEKVEITIDKIMATMLVKIIFFIL